MKLSTVSDEVRLLCLRLVLKPVAKYCLRNAYPFREFVAQAKRVFVEAAAEEIERTGERITESKISAMTGLHRRDTKVIEEPPTSDESSRSIMVRVVGLWEQKPEYRTTTGKPRVLDCKGRNSEFAGLVREISTHIRPGAVLYELKRLGLVEETPRGIRLKQSLASKDLDPVDGFKLVGKDLDLLLTTAEKNVIDGAGLSDLHIRTEYDNIYVKDIHAAKEWLIEEGKAFHRRARNYFAKIDKDIALDNRREQEASGGYVALSAIGVAREEAP